MYIISSQTTRGPAPSGNDNLCKRSFTGKMLDDLKCERNTIVHEKKQTNPEMKPAFNTVPLPLV